MKRIPIGLYLLLWMLHPVHGQNLPDTLNLIRNLGFELGYNIPNPTQFVVIAEYENEEEFNYPGCWQNGHTGISSSIFSIVGFPTALDTLNPLTSRPHSGRHMAAETNASVIYDTQNELFDTTGISNPAASAYIVGHLYEPLMAGKRYFLNISFGGFSTNMLTVHTNDMFGVENYFSNYGAYFSVGDPRPQPLDLSTVVESYQNIHPQINFQGFDLPKFDTFSYAELKG